MNRNEMSSKKRSTFIFPGDLIHVERPFAFVLWSDLKKQLCDLCFKVLVKPKACAVCLYVHYCDKECQKAAWFEHKKECKSLKNLANERNCDFVRLVGKVVINLKLYESKASEFYNLECRPDFANELFIHDLGNKVFSYLRGSRCLPAMKDIFGITLRVYLNFYFIRNRARSEGYAIYLGASAIQHACIPNAICVFKRGNIEVRAIEKISDGDKLENVTVAYFHLMELYRGDFSCDFGVDLFDRFLSPCRCKDCSCPAEESKLRKTLNKDKANDVINASQKFLSWFGESNFQNAPPVVFDALEKLLANQKGVLADTHLLRLKMFSLEIFINFERCPIVLKKGPRLVKLLKEVFGEGSGELLWLYQMLEVAAMTTKNDTIPKWKTKVRNLWSMHGYDDHGTILDGNHVTQVANVDPDIFATLAKLSRA